MTCKLFSQLGLFFILQVSCDWMLGRPNRLTVNFLKWVGGGSWSEPNFIVKLSQLSRAELSLAKLVCCLNNHLMRVE